MMDLFCTLLELLLLVLSAAVWKKSAADGQGDGRRDPVSDRPEETLEFVDCSVCGKPNRVGRVSCSACGALQATART
jgi:hypothetical protein